VKSPKRIGCGTVVSNAHFPKAEIEKWWPIIKAAGIKVE
jgi:hypothetical protein